MGLKEMLMAAAESQADSIKEKMVSQLSSDEMTKMISFMSDLDQNIMRVYGKNYNSFMESKDFNPFVEMYSPKFVEKVLNPAIERSSSKIFGAEPAVSPL